MKIELRKLSKIRQQPPRERQRGRRSRRLNSRVGFRQPIVVDVDSVIICGHTRFKAAQKLGLEHVPVHVATDLTPDQIKAYRIADNKASQLSDYCDVILQRWEKFTGEKAGRVTVQMEMAA